MFTVRHRAADAAHLTGRNFASPLLWLAAILLAVVHAQLFTVGYRVTADDVLMHSFLLNGIPDTMHQSWKIAVDQGRIGHFAVVMMSSVGAYFADFLWVRVFFVFLHFLPFLVLSIYVSRLLNRDIALFLFVIMAAMHPLAFYHLPPTSYPLQHSIAFAVIVVCRLLIFDIRTTRAQGVPIRRFEEVGLSVVLVVAALVDEHSFLLATGLMACELVSHLCRRADGAGVAAMERLAAIQRAPGFWMDVVAATVALGAYAAFSCGIPLFTREIAQTDF